VDVRFAFNAMRLSNIIASLSIVALNFVFPVPQAWSQPSGLISEGVSDVAKQSVAPLANRVTPPNGADITSGSTRLAGSVESRRGAPVIDDNSALNVSTSMSNSLKPSPIELPKDNFGGLVTDETVTLIGRDFYGYFVNAWRDFPLNDRYVVTVGERPSARYGSLVWVEYQHKHVFQTFLPAARVNVKNIGIGAATASYQIVMQADIQQLLFHDADLAPDEF